MKKDETKKIPLHDCLALPNDHHMRLMYFPLNNEFSLMSVNDVTHQLVMGIGIPLRHLRFQERQILGIATYKNHFISMILCTLNRPNDHILTAVTTPKCNHSVHIYPVPEDKKCINAKVVLDAHQQIVIKALLKTRRQNKETDPVHIDTALYIKD